MEAYEKLMLDIYSNINEPDGIYGINQSQSLDSQITVYEHERNWEKAIGVYDMMLQQAKQMNSHNMHLSLGLVNSLQNIGHFHLMDCYLGGFATKHPVQSAELSEFQFQTAWRASKWDLDIKESSLTDASTFSTSAYLALRSLHNNDDLLLQSTLKQARLDIVRNIGSISIESTKSVYPALVKLQFLSEIEEYWKAKTRMNL
jgi:ataxia telangiectasia mutated family protein